MLINYLFPIYFLFIFFIYHVKIVMLKLFGKRCNAKVCSSLEKKKKKLIAEISLPVVNIMYIYKRLYIGFISMKIN